MKDITGKKFGRWVAIRISEKRPNHDGGTRIFWECRCECGNIKSIDAASLKSGHSKSCGCYRKDYPKRKLPNGISERNHILRTYKKGAEARNLCFDLTTERFTELIHQNCFYCRSIPEKSVKGDGLDTHYLYNGIDRVDSSKGYTIDNCVPCCETCNRAKMQMSQNEFYSWIDKVYTHRHPDRLTAKVYYSTNSPFKFHDVYKNLQRD